MEEPTWCDPEINILFLHSPIFADKSISVNGEIFRIHSKAVVLYSGYFKTLFDLNCEFIEAGTSCDDDILIHLPEPKYFKCMLVYLYTGLIPEHSPEEIVGVVLNASFLHCPDYVIKLIKEALMAKNYKILMDKRLHLGSLFIDMNCFTNILFESYTSQQSFTLEVIAHMTRFSEPGSAIYDELKKLPLCLDDIDTALYLSSSNSPGMKNLQILYLDYILKAFIHNNKILSQGKTCCRCYQIFTLATKYSTCKPPSVTAKRHLALFNHKKRHFPCCGMPAKTKGCSTVVVSTANAFQWHLSAEENA